MGLVERLWKKDSETKSVSELSTELDLIIRDVTTLCTDARVLLFGSYANNTATDESDLDLAIILPDSLDKKTFKKEFYQTRTIVRISVDFIFRNKSEFEDKISQHNPIDEEIFQKGIEIYPLRKLNDKI